MLPSHKAGSIFFACNWVGICRTKLGQWSHAPKVEGQYKTKSRPPEWLDQPSWRESQNRLVWTGQKEDCRGHGGGCMFIN